MRYGINQRTRWLAVALVGLLSLLLVSTAQAAEFASDEVYRLETGAVVSDDLYVAGSEIYIDGTVEGDLVAAGSLVEVTGLVEGDVIAAGAAIRISGEVQDDVRAAGAGVDIRGTIGDDLFASAGGNSAFPVPGVNQEVNQGLRLADNATVNGEAVLVGGTGTIAGTIDENLHAFMSNINLMAQVGGNAELGGSTINVQEATQIAGTLSYRDDTEATIPAGVADEVVFIESTDQTQVNPMTAFLNWLWGTALTLLGFALLGWLVLRFAPRLLTTPARTIDERPVATGLSGLLASVVLVFLPIVSALLVFLMVLFGGWFPGVILGAFLFAALSLLWFLSPLVTGMWLGRKLRSTGGELELPTVLGAILLVVLLTQIPVVGWFIYLVSFVFAIGALTLARSTTQSAPSGTQAA